MEIIIVLFVLGLIGYMIMKEYNKRENVRRYGKKIDAFIWACGGKTVLYNFEIMFFL